MITQNFIVVTLLRSSRFFHWSIRAIGILPIRHPSRLRSFLHRSPWRFPARAPRGACPLPWVPRTTMQQDWRLRYLSRDFRPNYRRDSPRYRETRSQSTLARNRIWVRHLPPWSECLTSADSPGNPSEDACRRIVSCCRPIWNGVAWDDAIVFASFPRCSFATLSPFRPACSEYNRRCWICLPRVSCKINRRTSSLVIAFCKDVLPPCLPLSLSLSLSLSLYLSLSTSLRNRIWRFLPVVPSAKIRASSEFETSFPMSHRPIEATITADPVEGHFTEVWRWDFAEVSRWDLTQLFRHRCQFFQQSQVYRISLPRHEIVRISAIGTWPRSRLSR